MELPRSCIPTTIVALRRYPGFNDPAIVVHLVGRVVHETIGFIFHDITLDDATDRIVIRYIHNYQLPHERPKLVGTYVSVFGRFSATAPSHVISQSVRTASADAVSYHIIEVAYTFLRLSLCESRDGSRG